MSTDSAAPAPPERQQDVGSASRALSFSQLVFSDVAGLRPGSRGSWLGVLVRLPFVPGVIASILRRAQQCLFRSGHPRLAEGLRIIGESFVQLLKVLVVPLVFLSVAAIFIGFIVNPVIDLGIVPKHWFGHFMGEGPVAVETEAFNNIQRCL